MSEGDVMREPLAPEPLITYQVWRYRCPHCRRSWSKPGPTLAHASRCWYDPRLHGCKTCRHRDVGYEGGDFCAVDVDLTNPNDSETTMPIVHCDLWEATHA